MTVEAAVLDGNERGGGQRIELGDLDRFVLHCPAAGDRDPFLRHEQHGRIVERFERPAQGGGDNQP